jgi:EAL domain-containing protein (putative c-di-GMP-specific phosphodiesterase class I)
MDTNENDSEIVRTIVSLANELGMDTIAEGVENAEQLTRLESFRCQYGQGFYISRPLDQEAISALLDSEIANQLRSL